MAARTEDRKFGTFALDSTNGVVVVAWQNRLLNKVKLSSRLKADGSIAVSDRRDGQEVKLSGSIMGVDTGEVATRLGSFLAAINSGEDWLHLFSDRRLRARLAANVRYSLKRGSAGTVYDWSANFRSRIPFWESPTKTVDTFNETGAGPYALVTSNTAGDAPVFPVIKITNNGAGFTSKVITLTNVSSVKQLQLLGISLNSGQAVTVDMDEGRLGDGLASALTPFAIDGQWWEFSAAAAQTIEIAHTIGSGADLTFQVSWAPRFWEP